MRGPRDVKRRQQVAVNKRVPQNPCRRFRILQSAIRHMPPAGFPDDGAVHAHPFARINPAIFDMDQGSAAYRKRTLPPG
ncbi:hypothetical protein D3870_19370 [Noviherbaspirillum cavernae]|uniref:Uncharacterized protein n=1 Tax=Noviherbaspirillum cavernae TaxID=2320862 RepID=A0A418WVA7_9BURK|nr:hypothetical protein D3870_19370 [Noviherbaspirillum cavernae]